MCLVQSGFCRVRPRWEIHRGCWASWWSTLKGSRGESEALISCQDSYYCWRYSQPRVRALGASSSTRAAQCRAEGIAPRSGIICTTSEVIEYPVKNSPTETPCEAKSPPRHKSLKLQQREKRMDGPRDPYLGTLRRRQSARLMTKGAQDPKVTRNAETLSPQA